MRGFLFFLSSVLLVICLFTCKRKVFDPKAYDYLLYKEQIEVAPEPTYIFKAAITTTGRNELETSINWDTYGSAVTSRDTITVSGSVGESVMELKIAPYTVGTKFSVGEGDGKQPVSVSIKNKTGISQVYTSKSPSHGLISYIKLDNKYNQLEANFDMVLYNNTGVDLDSIIVRGYFKISFSPNSIVWTERNVLKCKAHTIWVNQVNDTYEVFGEDTINKRAIKIVIQAKSFNPGVPAGTGTANGLPTAYYTDPSRNYNNLRAYHTGNQKGTITVNSIEGNVIKGRFDGLRFGSDPNPAFFKVSATGTFSAVY